jgi:hypothetical protein
MRIAVFYRDITTTTFVPGRQLSNSNGTTAVTICSAPAASTQRVVDFINVINTDTVAKLVTIRYDASGTEYELMRATLGVGERLEYQDGHGWRSFTSDGSIKQTTIQGTNPTVTGLQFGFLAADVTNANAVANTIADVTGLSFPVTAGLRYWFYFYIDYTAAAGTTGSRWSINGPSFSRLVYESQYTLTTTTQTNNQSLNAYNLPAASNATSLATGNLARIEGFITPSADGTVIARFASEVANSAIVAKAGSSVQWAQVS